MTNLYCLVFLVRWVWDPGVGKAWNSVQVFRWDLRKIKSTHSAFCIHVFVLIPSSLL